MFQEKNHIHWFTFKIFERFNLPLSEEELNSWNEKKKKQSHSQADIPRFSFSLFSPFSLFFSLPLLFSFLFHFSISATPLSSCFYASLYKPSTFIGRQHLLLLFLVITVTAIFLLDLVILVRVQVALFPPLLLLLLLFLSSSSFLPLLVYLKHSLSIYGSLS